VGDYEMIFNDGSSPLGKLTEEVNGDVLRSRSLIGWSLCSVVSQMSRDLFTLLYFHSVPFPSFTIIFATLTTNPNNTTGVTCGVGTADPSGSLAFDRVCICSSPSLFSLIVDCPFDYRSRSVSFYTIFRFYDHILVGFVWFMVLNATFNNI
jgi:hypothetical protein